MQLSRLTLLPILLIQQAAICVSGGHMYQNQGDFSCTREVERSIPVLRKAYAGSMQKVLHVSPDTCSAVYALLKSDHHIEAWGIEPNLLDEEDVNATCWKMVRTGIVRVADIRIPLRHKPDTFSLVIVSDILDYLSVRFLKRAIPNLAKVSTDGVVIFTGYPVPHKVKLPETRPIYGRLKRRNEMWWIRYFNQTRFEENQTAIMRFDRAADKISYRPGCQIFHLKPQRL